MNVKYQIFVSSTYEDLKEERNEIIKASLNMGHIPVGMEMFNAADEEQWQVITRTIDQCDYYVVIIAHRYGSTAPEGISFTEKEYDYAVAQGVPVLGFIISEDAPWPNTKKDEQSGPLKALKRFKAKVKQKLVRFWRSAPELRSHFVESLTMTINLSPRRGWTRAPEAADADIAQALSNLAEENSRLRQELDDNRQSSVARSRVDDIADIISNDYFESDGGQIRASNVVISLINLFHQNDGRLLDFKMYEYFSEFDERRITAFVHKLVVLGVIAKTGINAYNVTDLSGEVYAKLLLRN